VRDLNKILYLRGLPGLSRNPFETRDYLPSFLEQHNIRHFITVGGSMDGYAALLCGALGAEEAHAFRGQTCLPTRRGVIFLKTIHSCNWATLRQQAELVLDRSCYDLRSHLGRAAQSGTSFHLYYCDDNPLDVQHVRHVAGIPGVYLHARASGGHHFSTIMRDSGELSVLLEMAVTRLGQH